MTVTLFNPNDRLCTDPCVRQRGVITLMLALLLLISLTTAVILHARTLLIEQRVSANDYRAKEANYAAEAALEYGIGWLQAHQPDFATWNAGDEFGDSETWNDLMADQIMITAGSDQYVLSVRFQRSCVQPDADTQDDTCLQWVIGIEAQAVAVSDSTLIRRQWMRVLQADIYGTGTFSFIRIPGSWRDWETE